MKTIQNGKVWGLVFLLYALSIPCIAEEPISYDPNELLIALKETDPELRLQAAENFVGYASYFGIDVLLPIATIAVQNEQSKIRYYAIEALVASALANQDNAQKLINAVPLLLEGFNDSDWEVRDIAAGALYAIYPRPDATTIRDPLVSLLNDPETKVVITAMGSLARITPDAPGVSDIILEMMNKPDPELKRWAAQYLGDIWTRRKYIDPTVIKALALALGDQDKFVRWQAANSLGRLRKDASEAIPYLEEVANNANESQKVRGAASASLKSIKGEVEKKNEAESEAVIPPNM